MKYNINRQIVMKSPKGFSRPDQKILYTSEGKIFNSYDKNIVLIQDGQVYLDEKYWSCSRTTGKYRNMFLDESITKTKSKINKGIYKFKDLN